MHRQSTRSNETTQARIFGSDDQSQAAALAEAFPGPGEMATIMRGVDWSKTALGPVASWPLALRMMAKFLLANRFPLLLWWGPQFCQLYNDAYRPVLGTKHPQFVGRPVSECWHEIWHILEPLIRTPFEGGPATWMEDLPLEINRHGFVEETHFTVAYSPVPDDTVPSGIGGVLATVHEISEKVIGERRVMALRDLGTGSSETRTAEQACARATEILSNYPKDFPFAMLYLLDSDRKRLRLAGTAGVEADRPISPAVIELNGSNTIWRLAEVLDSDQIQVTEGLANRFESIPLGPWADPPDKAVLIPIRSNVAHQPVGLLVAGISPRLRFDDQYRGFLDLASSQIATVIANARAYEEERKRAEALAEIDRAKTVFFSNVSHEFRTPLTLILGPIEHTLSEAGLPPDLHKRLQLVYRNSVRLLKLVNTLLDFSRIEAGRAEAVYQPTDLATFTKELATFFESVTDRAGLELRIECHPLDEPVYVDREMWEKIVLNLMSNAFKFTLQGGITLSLMDRRDAVVLTVKDTGVGISASDLPRLFERFHRAEGSRGRTFEGSGIGLALVQELVKLHGGNVSVESTPDKGSTFIVCIPKGYAHLPQGRIEAARSMVSTALGAKVYVEEAMRWIAEPESPSSLPPTQGSDPSFDDPALEDIEGSVVILADDNADMRDYVRRLLARHFRPVVVSNGQQALDAALREHPDLILTDVMMPVLDGFGLLKAIRANPQTSTIPIVMLSARAGEESHADGRQAGADDYLAKPFTARELLARVTSLLRLNKVRRDATRLIQEREEQLRQANTELAQRMAELRKANLAANDSRRAALNLTQDAVRSRQELETVNMALREGEERLRRLLDYQAAVTNNMAEGLYTLDAQGLVTFANPAVEAMLGWTKDELIGKKMHEMCHYKHADGTPFPACECPGLEVMENGKQLKEHEDVFIRKDGSFLPVTFSAAPLRADGRIVGVVVGFRDDTLRRQAESALKQSHATLERTVEHRTAAIRELSSSLLRSQDDERRKISRELHDSLGQYLAHAKMSLASLKRSDATEKENQSFTHLMETIEKCLTETRTISHLLHPPLLDEVGLSSAAKWYVEGFSERSGIPVRLETPAELKRLPAAIELALFRILQESLTNIHRHAHSPSVDVQLRTDADHVELRIRDYGEGIAADLLEQFRMNGTGVGVGLRSIRERITELGGQFDLQSDSKGTVIYVSAPILGTAPKSVA